MELRWDGVKSLAADAMGMLKRQVAQTPARSVGA